MGKYYGNDAQAVLDGGLSNCTAMGFSAGAPEEAFFAMKNGAAGLSIQPAAAATTEFNGPKGFDLA